MSPLLTPLSMMEAIRKEVQSEIKESGERAKQVKENAAKKSDKK